MSHTVRIAAAQYLVQRLHNWNEYHSKVSHWVIEAVREQAKILVFPEFAPMELASLADRRTLGERRSAARHTLGPLTPEAPDRRLGASLDWETDSVQPLVGDYLSLHAELADAYKVYILSGSLPLRGADGVLRNVAHFFAPGGTVGFQEKIVPTRWERETWGIKGGEKVKVFETAYGLVGIAICYDVEFPLIARRQAEAGARIILTPCCTSSLRGYHRVRVGARARALENQAYVIQAPTIGDAPWSCTVEVNVGSAGVYAPPDLGPRENGVVAQGPCNVAQWIFADLDLGAVERIRRTGMVANYDEWIDHLDVSTAVRDRFERLPDGQVAQEA